ncbi:MAG: low specificity L-threonine aldolase [Gemmatimonadetes bacterium]|nr:MAG: low specificity L-threonine aldolase [Gemmatimonadota bacterium]
MSSARPVIDLRSDTVTRPTAAMRRAMAEAEVGDDVLDGDPTVRRLEARVAALLGKEAGLFFPSGTMANQAALWVHTTPGTEVLLDAGSHIINWEMAGAAALAGVQVRPVLAGDGRAVASARDLERAIRPRSPHAPLASLVCVENTHNGAGGVVLPLEALEAVRAVADAARLPVHMDGARLWNAHVATGTRLADFARAADTVMLSFSKGLGCPVGAILVGSAETVQRAHMVRKRLGGGMRQSGILAAAALHALDHHMARLAEDHAKARRIAGMVAGAAGARVVAPDTNIVMVDLPDRVASDAVVTAAGEQGVRVTPWSASRIRAVTHLDVEEADVERAGEVVRHAIERARAD